MDLSSLRWVDLTHTLDEQVPTWTGSCGFRSEIKMDYEEGCRVLAYKCHAGIGTHIDAPLHFVRGGRDVASIPLENLIVPLHVIDVSKKAHADYFILPDDLKEYESRHGKIAKNSFVAAYTGWEKYWKKPEKYRNDHHFPGFHPDTITLMLKRKIAGIGIDTLSPDGSNTSDFPIHHLVLGAGLYILENLANLRAMPPSGSYILILPLKIRAGAESAVRALGVTKEKKNVKTCRSVQKPRL